VSSRRTVIGFPPVPPRRFIARPALRSRMDLRHRSYRTSS
jgi:hypothetical protein